MSEVTKTVVRYSRDFQGNLSVDPNGSWVLAADAAINAKRLMNHIDRAAAERDALLNEVGQVKGEYDRAVNKVDALQQRLTAADERADTATSLIQRIVANFDTEIECHEDVEPNDLEHDQVLTEMREFLAGSKPATCTWSEGGFSWHTGCGKEWQFTDGGLPAENGMHFCHSCGKALVVESAVGCGKPCACPGCDCTRRANSPFCAAHRSAKSRTRGQDPLTAEGLEWLMQNDGLQQ